MVAMRKTRATSLLRNLPLLDDAAAFRALGF